LSTMKPWIPVSEPLIRDIGIKLHLGGGPQNLDNMLSSESL
jgi:hypothetical protein